MPSAPTNALDAVAREIAALPDGAAWIHGALLKRLVEALRRDRARGGANVDEVATLYGRYFNAQAGGGGADEPDPFDVSVDATALTATFVPGGGQNLVPGNMLGTVVVPAGATSYAFLRLNTDGQSVQNCTLEIETTAPTSPVPTKNALPMQIDVLLHLIEYTAPTGDATTGTYTPHRIFEPATSVWLKSVEMFRTSNASAGPGELPYDTWYTWQPTNVDPEA